MSQVTLTLIQRAGTSSSNPIMVEDEPIKLGGYSANSTRIGSCENPYHIDCDNNNGMSMFFLFKTLTDTYRQRGRLCASTYYQQPLQQGPLHAQARDPAPGSANRTEGQSSTPGSTTSSTTIGAPPPPTTTRRHLLRGGRSRCEPGHWSPCPSPSSPH